MAAGLGEHALVVQTIGHLEPFDPNDSETFSQWYSRFQLYCATNLIPDEPEPNENGVIPANRRRTFFLTAIGKRAYGVLHVASLPGHPVEFSLSDLSGVLRAHYENPGLQEANRLAFHQRVQRGNESVFEFVSGLQELADHCNFGAFYEQALKGQLICGIRYNDTKAKLLAAGPTMTLEEAKILAFQDDAVRTQMRSIAQLHADRAGSSVHAMTTRSRPRHFQQQAKPSGNNPQFHPCYRCGQPHSANTCRAIQWTCHGCGKKGHIKKVCRSSKSNHSSPQKKPQGGNPRSTTVRHVSTTDAGASSDTIAEQLLAFPDD